MKIRLPVLRMFAVFTATAWLSLVVSFFFFPRIVAGQVSDSRTQGQPTSEFNFARLVYRNAAGSRRAMRGGAWSTDYPDAEYHLVQGISRLTRIEAGAIDQFGQGGRLITLTDDRVFDYPWLYAVEVGQWYLSEQEATQLRGYLDRGGFLLVDDFWGEYEWLIFVNSMKKVFPDRPIEELPENHELLHVHYDLERQIQIPGRRGPRPGTVPHWRAILDDKGRVMVAINFNMDMGDAWEHADDPWYPQPMTALAYRFAINYLVYAMTH